MRRAVRVIGDRHEIHIREIKCLIAAIPQPLTAKEAMQVHLPQTDGVAFLIAAADGRHTIQSRMVADRRQRTHRGFDTAGKLAVHRLRDIERTQIAGDIAADMFVAEVLAVGARLLHLQDFGAQVAHGHSALDRVRTVHGVLEQHVRVSGFELQFSKRHEEFTRINIRFVDAVIRQHLVIVFRDRNIGEWYTIDTLYIVRAEQGHTFAAFGQLESDIRNHHAEGQRFDADLLIRVLAFRVKEPHDIRVMRVEIHRSGTLARPQLVRVAERILQQFHNRHHAARLVFDAFDRGARLAQVRQQERHTAATLRQLQRRVDAS